MGAKKTLASAGNERKRNMPKAERVLEASSAAKVAAEALQAEALQVAYSEQAEAVTEAAEAEAKALTAVEAEAKAEVAAEVAAEAEAAKAEAEAAEAEALQARIEAEAAKAEALQALEAEAKAKARRMMKVEVAALRLQIGKLRQSDMQVDSSAILEAAEVAAAARKAVKENSSIYKNAVDVLYSWFFAFALSVAGTEIEKRSERHKKAREKCINAIGIAPDNKRGSDYNSIRARLDYYAKQLLSTSIDSRSYLTDDMTMEKWIALSPEIWEAITTEITEAKAAEAKAAEAKAAAEAAEVEAMKAELMRYRGMAKSA